MRWPKNFALSTFPVFRHCPTFENGRKSSKNYTYFPGINIRKNVPEFLTNVENVVNNRRLSKITKIYQDFQDKPLILALKMVKMALKIVKNHKYFTGNFDRQCSTVDFCLSTDCQKCTKIFVFRLLVFPVYFRKITRKPKTVSKTHNLTYY